MPSYSNASREKLKLAHPVLQVIFHEVIKSFDHTIIETFRDEEKQNRYNEQGLSQLKWPNSEHNSNPSLAIDAAPYPIDWNNIERFKFFGGFVLGVADCLFNNGIIEYRIRWGGDWNRNFKMTDNNFNDFVHFEMMPRN